MNKKFSLPEREFGQLFIHLSAHIQKYYTFEGLKPKR